MQIDDYMIAYLIEGFNAVLICGLYNLEGD